MVERAAQQTQRTFSASPEPAKLLASAAFSLLQQDLPSEKGFLLRRLREAKG